MLSAIRSFFGRETNDASRTTYEVDGLLGHPADTSVIGRPRAETESNCGAIAAGLRGLPRIIHEGSLRKCAAATRVFGDVKSLSIHVQYGEGLNGETDCQRPVSALAAVAS